MSLPLGLSVSNGVPFSLSYFLETDAVEPRSNTVGVCQPGQCPSSDTAADAWDPLRLTFDLPSGASISSDGGFTQGAVPEPASLTLYATGLLGLVGFARRRFTLPRPAQHI